MEGALPNGIVNHNKIGQIFMETLKPQNVIQKNLEAVQDLRKALAGAVSGAISKTIVAPLTRITILYQVQSYQNKGFVGLPLHQALVKVIEQQGVLALWRGNLVSIIHRVPNQAIGFYVQENVRDSLDPFFNEDAKGDFVKGLISGTIAGSASCFLTYPLDTIRTRLAADLVGGHKNDQLFSMLQKQIMTEGMTGIFRGVGVACLQVAPAAALNFAVYDTLKMQWLQRNNECYTLPPLVSLVFGGLGGIVASTFTHPLDVVRKGLQVQGMKNMRVMGGYRALFLHILKEQGLRGLYAGIYPEYIKVFISAGLNFCVYESVKGMLGVPAKHRRQESS